MNGYGNGTNQHSASAQDIRAILEASFEDEREPSSAMLARAMIYAQDADRKLNEAKAVKAQAEKFRTEMQRTAVEQTETMCRQLREEAEEDRAAAEELRQEAETMWESAKAELDRATALREEAENIRVAANVEAEEHRRYVIAEAEREAITIKDNARTQVNAELAEKQEQVDEELRSALAAIEKMQSAAAAELEAQQLYTEALRFRASSPSWEDEPQEEHTEESRPATPKKRSTTARKTKRS